MAKFKNISGSWLRFDLDGKEKIVENGHSFSAEPNDYLRGAIALGHLASNDDELDDIAVVPDAAVEPSPKTSGK